MFTVDRVLREETVDAQRGLSRAEVASRAERFGANKFDARKPESRWHVFGRQYQLDKLTRTRPGRSLRQSGQYIRLNFTTLLFQAVGLGWAEQARTQAIAHTMGVVTFSLYALWLICICVALSIIVAAEIRKAVRRRRTSAEVVPAERPAVTEVAAAA